MIEFSITFVNGKWIIGADNTSQVRNGLKEWSSLGPVLNIPSEINGHKIEELGYRAFYKCDIIEDVIIEDGIKQINGGCFSYCRNLKSVTIPPSVELIGDGGIHALNGSIQGTSKGTLIVTFLPKSKFSFIYNYGISRKERIIVHYYGVRKPKFQGSPFGKATLNELKVFAPYVSKFLGEKTIRIGISQCAVKRYGTNILMLTSLIILSS